MEIKNVSEFLIEQMEKRAHGDLAALVAEVKVLEGRQELRPSSLSYTRSCLSDLTRSLERLDAMREIYTQSQKEAAQP